MRERHTGRVQLGMERFEDRTTPVIGNYNLATALTLGTGYDGVVQIRQDGWTAAATGTLLPTGRHILTAAHNLVNDARFVVPGPRVPRPVTVGFDMPNVGRIDIRVPAEWMTIPPGYLNAPNLTTAYPNDIAVITLPELAPSGPPGFGADRFDINRTPNDLGQDGLIVGYGIRGTGATGQQRDLPFDGLKRAARNRIELPGERLGYLPGFIAAYDFDSGMPANDMFGRMFGQPDVGLPDEGVSAPGDSGGPIFLTQNGRQVVGFTVAGGGLGADFRPPNPALGNPAARSGFGDMSIAVRVFPYVPFIDNVLNQPGPLTVNMRSQVVGVNNAQADVVFQVDGANNLQMLVNGVLYHTVPLTRVTEVNLVGVGVDVPATTTVTVQNGVPLALRFQYLQVANVADNRAGVAPPPTVGPGRAAPAAPAGAADLTDPDLPPIDFTDLPNLFTPSTRLAVGGTNGRVWVYDLAAGNKLIQSFQGIPGWGGAVSMTLGDVTGDLVRDVVIAAGPGGGPHVRVLDGATGAEVRNLFAFEQGFRGGVSVSVGDVNADGVGDLVVGARAGGGPRVRVLDGRTAATLYDFFAFDAGFTGGVNVAVGDVDDDGFDDLTVGAGAGGGPHVKVFSGRTGQVLRNFMAYDAGFTGGVNVAVGDLDGDGHAEVITGAGAGGSPHVKSFDGQSGIQKLSYFAYDAAFLGGVSVAAVDADDDGLADIATGAGPGIAPHVKVFGGRTQQLRLDLFAFDQSLTDGVVVGGQG